MSQRKTARKVNKAISELDPIEVVFITLLVIVFLAAAYMIMAN